MFKQRREKFMGLMRGGIAIIPANAEITRSADGHYPFCQNKNFLYLTGFPEPDAIALLMPKHPEHRFVLFVRPRDKSREIWDGRRFGPEGAKSQFGADVAYTIAELDEVLPRYLENQDVLYHGFGNDPAFDARVHRWLDMVRGKSRQGVIAPAEFVDPNEVIHEMRLIKDEHDLATMRAAAKISVGAHIRGMAVTKPGMFEYELGAEMEHHCRMRGSRNQAYSSIVGSGDNANILHYRENDRKMEDGDIVCVDLGCELDGYASDITRAWPVNGRFTPEQKIIYDLVLKAHQEAIKRAKAGNTIRNTHETAAKVLAQGLIDLGILKGDAETHMRVCIGDDKETRFPEGQPVLKDFYMHGTSHWIGMDVHDVGRYRKGDQWRKLEPGMCFTVEPGLYFSVDNPRAPDRFRGIGIRIEDDIHVTRGEPEYITKGLPLTSADVEAACRGDFPMP
ncbi:MAG: aminopeptidase P N-terminal domain-containing protein [Planctomycetes bacterium]|nr:aminopeptidase P N-terminal domain-containing protein [Planctomycetota bacterium]NUQ34781.1 aminopeptidase P N-terminal domain-containing protein [Planctomycetaceae bacterium]